MKTDDIHKLLDEAIEVKGTEEVVAVLDKMLNRAEASVLTIIANAGVHEIPKAYLRGEVYEASRGDWNASSEKALLLELTAILSRLAKKLRAGPWKRVYLIPTGHPILSLQIKAMVYRILRFNTVDLYHKAGTYFEGRIHQRAIALDAVDRA